jgi:hypothetical protein
MIRRFTLALTACLWASLAFGQANNSSNWQTPGNQVVPGWVPLNVRPDNLAGVPTSVTAVFTGADTASATATLSAAAGQFTYICGFNVSGLGATAATSVTPTVTGLPNTLTYTGAFTFAAGATVADAAVSFTYAPCLPSSAVNTGIVVTVPGAAGNTALSINAWGYRQ